MTTYLGLYVMINIFCIILLFVFLSHSRIGMGEMVPQRRFSHAVLMLVIFFASDTLWYAMDCGSLPQIRWLSILLKSIYFLSASAAGYFWFLYMETLIGMPFTDNARSVAYSSALIWVHLLLCIINPFSGLLFTIGRDFEYSRGPLFGLQYVVIYAYLVTASCNALYMAFRKENYVDRTRYIVIAMFPVLPAISGLLQLMYWRIPFNCMAFTLAVIIVYLTEISQQISQEPLTQLANRKQFMRFLEQNVQGHEKDGMLFLFMIDMNRFKQINDKFGHMEGDRAIIMTAEALKRACVGLHRRYTLARYGGDEFAIAVIMEDEKECEELKSRIFSELDVQNEKIVLDYRLSLSVGAARYQAKYNGIRDLITAADAELYKEKERAHT